MRALIVTVYSDWLVFLPVLASAEVEIARSIHLAFKSNI